MKKIYFYTFIFICNISFAQYANVSTIGGTGNQDYTGDGGQAIDADISLPTGIAIDNAGNIYFSEVGNSVVRKIAADGIITTVAGQVGQFGFSGDGGIATSAKLNFPTGIAVDTDGNLYICDKENHRIRKVDVASGNITTVAGNGTDGSDGDGGQAISAQLNTPQGVVIDANGNLYICDDLNNKIRKVTTNGIITTIAGTGEYDFSGDGGLATAAKLKGPIDIDIDNAGNIFFADDDRIRKIDSNGIITTVAGKQSFDEFNGDGGLAIDAKFNDPRGVIVDALGNIFITDSSNHRIRKVTTDGIINTIVGTGSIGFFGGGFNGDGQPGTETQLKSPSDIVIDGTGSIIIADYKNHRIRKLSASALGVNNFAVSKVNLFPNPITNGEPLIIESQETITHISIYNAVGQEIYRANPNSTKHSPNLKNQKSGVYFIKIALTNASTNTRKLIVN